MSCFDSQKGQTIYFSRWWDLIEGNPFDCRNSQTIFSKMENRFDWLGKSLSETHCIGAHMNRSCFKWQGIPQKRSQNLNFLKNSWKLSQFLDFFPLPERSELNLANKTLPDRFLTTNGENVALLNTRFQGVYRCRFLDIMGNHGNHQNRENYQNHDKAWKPM